MSSPRRRGSSSAPSFPRRRESSQHRHSRAGGNPEISCPCTEFPASAGMTVSKPLLVGARTPATVLYFARALLQLNYVKIRGAKAPEFGTRRPYDQSIRNRICVMSGIEMDIRNSRASGNPVLSYPDYEWWVIRQVAHTDIFDNPKLIYQDLASRPKFALNTDGSFPSYGKSWFTCILKFATIMVLDYSSLSGKPRRCISVI
jgi:hypothetical protein